MSSHRSYGATEARGATGDNTLVNNSHDETTPLLATPKPSGSFSRRIRRNLTAEVSRDWGDLVLLTCYIVTGLLDSASTQVWGAFVSMQTGNSVYVGLGLSSLVFPPVKSRLWRSGISLLSFCVGSFFFARFHRYFSPKRRWVLVASFTAQTLLTLAAATIVHVIRNTGGNSDGGDLEDGTDSTEWHVLVPLALVAFQSCGQAVTSRALKYNSLTSVVLTSIYCDLFSDKDLLAWPNVERNRRAAAPVLLIFGAFLGGIFSYSPFGVEGALWTAAVLKGLMVVAWFLWPEEEEQA